MHVKNRDVSRIKSLGLGLSEETGGVHSSAISVPIMMFDVLMIARSVILRVHVSLDNVCGKSTSTQHTDTRTRKAVLVKQQSDKMNSKKESQTWQMRSSH